MYRERVKIKVVSIMKDANHPLYCEFKMLASGKNWQWHLCACIEFMWKLMSNAAYMELEDH